MKQIIEISKKISDCVDSRQLRDYLERIYQLEKSFSFSAFKKAAEYCYSRLNEMGLEAKYLNVPFDGETKIADWTMPLAWEANDATLSLLFDDDPRETVLLDRTSISQHLILWSSGTPPEGLVAGLKWVDQPEQITADRIRGHFILTTLDVSEVKQKVAAAGGVGIISYQSRPNAPDNAVPWLNCWSDDPDGWAFTTKDCPLIGFSVSNEIGAQLKALIFSEQKFKLKARVDARNFKDELPLVVADIPGTSDESVLLLAHLFEPGANDNASGAAALLESARVLSRLIETGQLSQPRRTIKFLLTSEIYGTLNFIRQNASENSRIVAALNVDSIGRLDYQHGKMVVHQVPDSALSFVGPFFEELAELMTLTPQLKFLPFTLADNFITDPKIGIPCPYLGVVDEFWHTSLDVPETIDYDLMSRFTALSAVYAWSLATAGPETAKWLAQLLATRKISQMRTGFDSSEHLDYFRFVSTNQLKSITTIDDSPETNAIVNTAIQSVEAEFVIKNAKREVAGKNNQNRKVPEQTEIVPVRRFAAPLSFLEIPPAERKQHQINVWIPTLKKALFWIDGKRTLDDVIRLTELENQTPLPWLRGALDALLENRALLEKITFERLVHDLRKLGLKKGDRVGVHSSLKSLGYVEGGAETVIQVLLEVIGPEGTLLMPLFNHPEPKIDLRTAPSRLGAITEKFRTYPGVVRSHNATHSVGVIGADAEYFAAGHETGTQLGIDSPFHRLAQHNGWILHLGTNFNSSSLIHVSEAIAGAPYLDVAYPGYDRPIEFTIEDGTTRTMPPKETPGDSVTFFRVQQEMEHRELLISGKVGMAESILAKGKDILDAAGEMLQKDPGILLCDNPDCPVCPASKEKLLVAGR